MPKKITTKKQSNTKAKTPKKTLKNTKASYLDKCYSKPVKEYKGATAYFWGGLGIVLCATGALIVLLWGIGMMIQ